ncbi:MAG: MFS transporter [Phycisphaerae bacterium]|nr:MFS transporter [Phycisphaerae bacterium]
MTTRTFTNIPFAPRRCPVFYGWVIVAVSTLVIICSIPGQTMGVGVFTDYLIEALGLSREQLSRAYMFGTIASGTLLPIAGWLLDRLGVRVMAILASAGLAVSLLVVSRSDAVARAAASVIGASAAVWIGMTTITASFMLMRFFGQGTLTMIGRVAMGKWFNHRRGLATAISGIFVTFAFSAAPLLLNLLIDGFGWRRACVVLAAAIGGGMSLIAWVFYRDNPEQCGMVMDGVTDPEWLDRKAKRATEIRREFTRPEAMRTLTFWAFSLGLSTYGLVITGVTFHLTSLGEEMGRSRAATLAIFWPMSVIGVVARFISSWLSDRSPIGLKWHLFVMMAAEVVGTVGVLFFHTRAGWVLAALGYGVTGGLMGALLNIAWPRFFGRRHLGAISGLNMSVMVWASAVGPWLFSLGHRFTGDYRTAIAGCLVLPAVVMAVALKADNPQQRCCVDDTAPGTE